MVDIVSRVKILNLVGKLMDPQKYKDDFTLKMEETAEGQLTGTFTLTGELAKLLKEFKPHVERAMDQKAKRSEAVEIGVVLPGQSQP